MSLISAVADKERTTQPNSNVAKNEHMGTKATKRSNSIYQPQGGSLSREALYRAKMKYGFYQSPATKTSVGVKDAKAATDAAAVLAHSNQQTVEAYKRLLDPNATKAASKVAKNSRSRSSSVASNNLTKTDSNQSKASAAASKAFSMGVKEEALNKKIQDNVSIKSQSAQTYSIRSANSVLTAYSQNVNAPKPKVESPTKKMNLSKILKGAERRAEKRIKQRTEPDVNYSYGVKTNSLANNQFTLSKDMMENIMAKTNQQLQPDSKGTITRSRGSSIIGADKVKDEDPSRFAREAAYAVRDLDTRTPVDDDIEERAQKRATYLSQLTSTTVLAKARANVDRELQKLEKDDYGRKLFTNDVYNRAAVTIAQKNLAQKRAQVNNKINMGGGLWLSPEDIQKISQNLLNPVLGEITERADSQRAADIEIAERTKALQNSVQNWNVLQSEKIKNDTKYVEDSDTRLAKEKEDAKVAADAKYKAMIDNMEAELAEQNADLAKTKQMFDDLKLEMSMRVDLEEQRAAKELANWNETRENDLADALVEQKQLLEPYLVDLKLAEEEHDDLIKEYGTIDGKISFLNKSIANHKVKISNYEKDLEGQTNREERDVLEQNELGENKETLDKEVNDKVIIEANKAKEIAELSAKELQLKQLEIDAKINERKSELNTTEISLQKEKLNLLDVMKQSAELNGEEQLDEEKVKGLIGMTSTEFLAKVRAENAITQPETSTLENIKEVEEPKSIVAVAGAAKTTVSRTVSTPVEPVADPVADRKPNKFGIGNIFMGSRTSHNSKKIKEQHPAPTPVVVEKTNDTVTKNKDTLAVPGNENKDTEKSDNALTPSFSGFSQGSSINNEDEDGPLNEAQDNIETNSEPQEQGYLKEVF